MGHLSGVPQRMGFVKISVHSWAFLFGSEGRSTGCFGIILAHEFTRMNTNKNPCGE